MSEFVRGSLIDGSLRLAGFLAALALGSDISGSPSAPAAAFVGSGVVLLAVPPVGQASPPA